jgi:glutamate formiminotransferase
MTSGYLCISAQPVELSVSNHEQAVSNLLDYQKRPVYVAGKMEASSTSHMDSKD